MSSMQIAHVYPNGTKIQRKDGNVFVKVRGEWRAEHRLIAEFKIANRELLPGEKVCHKDNTLLGENGFNECDNLVIIKCRTRRWVKLKKSKIIYMPPKTTKELVFK